MELLYCPDNGKKQDIFSTNGGKRLAEENNIPFLGGIPIEPAIRIGGDKGKPIVLAEPNSSYAESFRTVSRNVAAQISIANIKKAMQPKKEPPPIKLNTVNFNKK